MKTIFTRSIGLHFHVKCLSNRNLFKFRPEILVILREIAFYITLNINWLMFLLLVYFNLPSTYYMSIICSIEYVLRTNRNAPS